MSDAGVPLGVLYGQFDAIAKHGERGDSRVAHAAVVDRLAANRSLAEADGWTGCTLSRSGGSGRLELWGVPPTGVRRDVVPDYPGQGSPDSVNRTG